MDKTLITICARGGSKGIPRKNIKLLDNRPLIYYSLKAAEEFSKRKGNTHIVLSTDDNEIKKIVVEISSEIDTNYKRPDFLAGDTAGKLDAIVDVKKYMEQKHHISYHYVIDLDVTSPLRNFYDLDNALGLLKNNLVAYNIFSVSPANRNPYFNMVEQQEDEYFSLCKKGAFLTRQSAPKVYDMNASFYVFTKQFFERGFRTVITDRSLVYEVPHLCFDLDHPIDFDIMSFLVENNKLDFELLK